MNDTDLGLADELAAAELSWRRHPEQVADLAARVMTPPVMPNAKLLERIAQLEAEVERLRDHRDRLLAAIDGEWYGALGYGYAWEIAKGVRADDPTAPPDPGPDEW